MLVFTCAENDGDHIGAAQRGAEVLIVVTEHEVQEDSAELVLSTLDARRLASTIRAVANGGDRDVVDTLHVIPSESEGHVLLSADHGEAGWRSVVLPNEDAEKLAAGLFGLSDAAELFATRERVGATHPAHESVMARMTTRALALSIATQALGKRNADILAVAKWLAGEEAVA